MIHLRGIIIDRSELAIMIGLRPTTSPFQTLRGPFEEIKRYPCEN